VNIVATPFELAKALKNPMGSHYERRYLVDRAVWVPQGTAVHIKQCHLIDQRERLAGLHIDGADARLTIHGIADDATATEFEDTLAAGPATLLFDSICAQPVLDLHRFRELHQGRAWEIDVYDGPNAGLVLARTAVAATDETVDLPAWVVKDVSADAHYDNASLLNHPFNAWGRPGR